MGTHSEGHLGLWFTQGSQTSLPIKVLGTIFQRCWCLVPPKENWKWLWGSGQVTRVVGKSPGASDAQWHWPWVSSGCPHFTPRACLPKTFPSVVLKSVSLSLILANREPHIHMAHQSEWNAVLFLRRINLWDTRKGIGKLHVPLVLSRNRGLECDGQDVTVRNFLFKERK